MKRFIPLVLGAFIVAGCARKEVYVDVAEKAVLKTVAITVSAVMMITTIKIEDRDLKIERSTQTVHIRGAGVFITPKGHIVTAAHLFWANKVGDITVCESNGDCRAAELLYKEDNRDLALIKIEGDDHPCARIADPRRLKVGQEVLAIGSPLGFDFSVTHGIISALYRDGLGVYNMTQSDAFINPGNSGGPLFNLKGELVGINSRIAPHIEGPVFTGLGFSVQCGQIMEFLVRFRGLDKAGK